MLNQLSSIRRPALGIGTGALACLLAATGSAPAQAATYPARAPIAQYMMASPAAEIALARTAASPSISANAEILVLGPHGYTTAVKGGNGFVCLVERAWDAELGNPVFWNPHNRGPDCLNPAAARSVLPHMIERTRWALAGLSVTQMRERTKAEVAAKSYVMPEPGAMAYMLSKQQYLSDNAHNWHPHLMFFVASSDAAMGANFAGSPVIHAWPSAPDPVSTFLVPVGTWSDGTPATMK
jgi:hypothetical protein